MYFTVVRCKVLQVAQRDSGSWVFRCGDVQYCKNISIHFSFFFLLFIYHWPIYLPISPPPTSLHCPYCLPSLSPLPSSLPLFLSPSLPLTYFAPVQATRSLSTCCLKEEMIRPKAKKKNLWVSKDQCWGLGEGFRTQTRFLKYMSQNNKGS